MLRTAKDPKSAQHISQLKEQIDLAKIERDLLDREIREKQKQLAEKKDAIRSLNDKIRDLQVVVPVITLTDHAIARYFERVKGVSIQDVKNEVITPDLIKLVSALGGTGKFPMGEHQIVMKDYAILTII